MKPNLIIAWAGALSLALLSPIVFAGAPSGKVLELHACEVYTGGCTASSEATLGGRSLVRFWQIDTGSFAGADLAGLPVAALQVAQANLAFSDTQASSTVLYLPEAATPAQREALRAWLEAAEPEMAGSIVAEKTAPIHLLMDGPEVSASVGQGISLKTRPLEACDAGGCGEQLWYAPRSKTGAFTVLVNAGSSVTEPALELVWKDSGRRSVFAGRFGPAAEEPVFQLAAAQD